MDRPILFQGEMVRAILAGEKTMTRREVPAVFSGAKYVRVGYGGVLFTDPMLDMLSKEPDSHLTLIKCKYGQPGDRLWVREAWKIASFMEGDPMRFQYRADMGEAEENEHYSELTYEGWFERVCVQSTDYLEKIKWPNKNEEGVYSWENGKSPLPWRPSIFMPRWVSRITLEIVNVRVERVHDIKVSDLRKEGIDSDSWDDAPGFINLWDSVNAKRGYGWDVNPWVWVIEFKKVPNEA